jgi:hypothetical protein
MRKIINIIVVCFLLIPFTIQEKEVEAATTFKDVREDHWGKKEIEYLVDQGIINGYPDGTFKPNNPVKDINVLEMLLKSLKYPITDTYPNPGYSDLEKGKYGYEIIATAVHFGVLSKGNGSSRFEVNREINRAIMGQRLIQAYKLSRHWEENFNDVNIPSWFYHQAETLAAYGITVPYEGKLFKPGSSLTRAQFAAFLYRTLHLTEEIKNPPYVYTQFSQDIDHNGIIINLGNPKQEVNNEFNVAYSIPVKIVNNTSAPIKEGAFKLQYENYPYTSVYDIAHQQIGSNSSKQFNAYFSLSKEQSDKAGFPKVIEFVLLNESEIRVFYEPLKNSVKWKFN